MTTIDATPNTAAPNAAAPNTATAGETGTAAPASATPGTEVQQLAAFAASAELDDMSPQALEQLKIRVLDTLGVAIGALDAEPLKAIRGLLGDLEGDRATAPAAAGTESGGNLGSLRSTLIGGGSASPERAAFYNSALSRYLDFMDAYLAPGETNHPSDNFGAVLAAAESAGASGKELLTAFAVAYQIHTRLSDVAPVRARGFDHTTQGAFAAAAAAGRAFGLSAGQIANAAAMAGTANVALRVTRTGNLSHWKGRAYPHVAKEGTWSAMLAGRGITGPEEVFEGNKGFKDSVAGDFTIDWSAEDLESVARTIIKKHNAEIHSQSALDAAQEIRRIDEFHPERIKAVRLQTFDVAHSIIVGGEEGSKQLVRTKEEADHSLPWMLAVVLLDGELNPAQYESWRITADDVQDLMTKVTITPRDDFSARFPAEMPAYLEVELDDGTVLHAEADAYDGFTTQPLDWAGARAKFDAVAGPFTTGRQRDEIAEVVHGLEHHTTADLTALLAGVSTDRL